MNIQKWMDQNDGRTMSSPEEKGDDKQTSVSLHSDSDQSGKREMCLINAIGNNLLITIQEYRKRGNTFGCVYCIEGNWKILVLIMLVSKSRCKFFQVTFKVLQVSFNHLCHLNCFCKNLPESLY